MCSSDLYWKLVVLAGTEESELELNSQSNIPMPLTYKLSKLLRVGGKKNYEVFKKMIWE